MLNNDASSCHIISEKCSVSLRNKSTNLFTQFWKPLKDFFSFWECSCSQWETSLWSYCRLNSVSISVPQTNHIGPFHRITPCDYPKYIWIYKTSFRADPSAIYVLGRYPLLLDDLLDSVMSCPSFTDHELRACVQRTCETDKGKATK